MRKNEIEFYISGSTWKKRTLAAQLASASKKVLFNRTENVYINIELIYNLNTKEGVRGDVLDEGDREFTIRIDSNQAFEEFCLTLCHEMIHVKQYCKKELSQPTGRMMKWKNEIYSTDLQYELRPWEVEAHTMEKEVYEKSIDIIS